MTRGIVDKKEEKKEKNISLDGEDFDRKKFEDLPETETKSKYFFEYTQTPPLEARLYPDGIGILEQEVINGTYVNPSEYIHQSIYRASFGNLFRTKEYGALVGFNPAYIFTTKTKTQAPMKIEQTPEQKINRIQQYTLPEQKIKYAQTDEVIQAVYRNDKIEYNSYKLSEFYTQSNISTAYSNSRIPFKFGTISDSIPAVRTLTCSYELNNNYISTKKLEKVSSRPITIGYSQFDVSNIFIQAIRYIGINLPKTKKDVSSNPTPTINYQNTNLPRITFEIKQSDIAFDDFIVKNDYLKESNENNVGVELKLTNYKQLAQLNLQQNNIREQIIPHPTEQYNNEKLELIKLDNYESLENKPVIDSNKSIEITTYNLINNNRQFSENKQSDLDLQIMQIINSEITKQETENLEYKQPEEQPFTTNSLISIVYNQKNDNVRLELPVFYQLTMDMLSYDVVQTKDRGQKIASGFETKLDNEYLNIKLNENQRLEDALPTSLLPILISRKYQERQTEEDAEPEYKRGERIVEKESGVIIEEKYEKPIENFENKLKQTYDKKTGESLGERSISLLAIALMGTFAAAATLITGEEATEIKTKQRELKIDFDSKLKEVYRDDMTLEGVRALIEDYVATEEDLELKGNYTVNAFDKDTQKTEAYTFAKNSLAGIYHRLLLEQGLNPEYGVQSFDGQKSLIMTKFSQKLHEEALKIFGKEYKKDLGILFYVNGKEPEIAPEKQNPINDYNVKIGDKLSLVEVVQGTYKGDFGDTTSPHGKAEDQEDHPCGGVNYKQYHPDNPENYRLNSIEKNGKLIEGALQIGNSFKASDLNLNPDGASLVQFYDKEGSETKKIVFENTNAVAMIDAYVKTILNATPVWREDTYTDSETKETRTEVILDHVREYHVKTKKELGNGSSERLGLIVAVNNEEPGRGTIPVSEMYIKSIDDLDILVINQDNYNGPGDDSSPHGKLNKDKKDGLISEQQSKYNCNGRFYDFFHGKDKKLKTLSDDGKEVEGIAYIITNYQPGEKHADKSLKEIQNMIFNKAAEKSNFDVRKAYDDLAMKKFGNGKFELRVFVNGELKADGYVVNPKDKISFAYINPLSYKLQ